MFEIKRTDEEVCQVLNTVADAINDGVCHYPGMSYEDGISAFADWLFGYTDDTPFD